MYGNPARALSIVMFAAVMLLPAHAKTVKLGAAQFPEKRTVELSFKATPIAPTAQLDAKVDYRNGQARIELAFSDMKPAILFGGDVTCYVVWAVTRDGQVENLGELVTRKRNGTLNFSTGKKNFALMVTAESFFLVAEPSELLVFTNRGTMVGSRAEPFHFDAFVEAPRHSMDAIGHIKWDSKVPIELLQARKAHELAERNDARKHAGKVFYDAGAMLRAANGTAVSAPKSRELLDYSRRAVALSNEALNISLQRIESIELERRLVERRAETEALERRAAEAEAAAERVRAETERTIAETAALREERTSLENSMLSLKQEKNDLQHESQRLVAEMTALDQQRRELSAESQRFQRERDELRGRLQNALSHVASTEDSARGLVVNLPDILFDVNEDTLKPEARIVMAKLAGILLIMEGQGAMIEGHTDSTGDAAYNLDLSRRRANAVKQFMQVQGVAPERLIAKGFGVEHPVAENATAEGRGRNRRVEFIISNSGSSPVSN